MTTASNPCPAVKFSETAPVFTKTLSVAAFSKKDPKFLKFGEEKLQQRKKKIKMSESFTAAKLGKPLPTSAIIYPEPGSSVKHDSQSMQTQTRQSKLTDDLIIEHFGTSSKSQGEYEEEEEHLTIDSNELDEDEDDPDLDTPNPQGRFVCKSEDCNQNFATRKELRRHKLSHRVRKHICPLEDCGRAFFEKSKLKRHMVVHTKKKEHSCPSCGKKFGYKANVKTHMRTHTGERPFMCRISGCGKTFAQASNRNAHEKTHFKTSDDRRRIRLKNRSSDESFSVDSSVADPEEDNLSTSSSARKRKISTSVEAAPSLAVAKAITPTKPKPLALLPDMNLSPVIKTAKEKSAKNEIQVKSPAENPELAKPVLDHSNPATEIKVKKYSGTTFLDLDELMPDLINLGSPPAISAQQQAQAAADDAFNNLFFNSFTSLGYSNNHDSELHSFFKNDFGLNLDTLTEHDLFSNHVHVDLPILSPLSSAGHGNLSASNLFSEYHFHFGGTKTGCGHENCDKHTDTCIHSATSSHELKRQEQQL